MKEYYVDVSHLSAEEKQLTHDKLDMMDFMTSYYFGDDNKIVGLVVGWDSKADFGD